MSAQYATQPLCLGSPADNERLALEEYKAGKTTVRSLPSVVTFALTTFCNNMLPCLICDRNVRMRIADRECDERVIHAMEPLLRTARMVLLHCGGEAMFSKHFNDVIAAVQPPARVSFATNAMLMARSRADRMLERDIMSRIVVSMDAATPEVYRVMRPSCRFDVVTRNIRYYAARAKALGRSQAEVELNMTVCRTNLDDVPKLVDLAADLGAQSVSYQRLNAGLDYTARTVDGADWNYVEESRLDPALSNAKVSEAFREAEAAGIGISFIGNPLVEESKPQAETAPAAAPKAAQPAGKDTRAPVTACMKPWHEINVLPDGEVRICCYHDYPRCSLGNVLDGDFMDIWNSPRMVAERASYLANGFSTEFCARSPAVCAHRGRE